MSVLLLCAACAPLVEIEGPDSHKLAQVLAPPPEVTPAMQAEPEVDFLALSPAMKDFVAMVVRAGASREQRTDALFETLRDNAAFSIDYDANATLSAAETFRQRRGNCLAFSAMFIAMAREAGVDARFQQVDVPPSWDSQGGDTLVQYQHVNVKVHLGRQFTGVIDLRVDLYRESYPKRLLSDAEALAHYYSNISVGHLLENRLGEAYVAVRRALLADSGQGFVWNTMGIVQRRLGNLELAEASFRQALTLNPRDWLALGNLANVYAIQGDGEQAARLRALSDVIKLRNPYYRYALAQRAYRLGAYDEARVQLDLALSGKRDESRFYYLRGMSLWKLGEATSAVDDMRKAIRIAREEDVMALYQRQLDEWRGGAG
jgi:Flp pilus assembly protein TadD